MLIENNFPIILASTSKVRNEILKSCKLDFEVMKPLYDEDGEKQFLPKMSPKKMAIFLEVINQVDELIDEEYKTLNLQ